MECSKVAVGVKKAKKKQGKDEFDRIKQAEKKKRRLEKALATSAAIRLELEKKKQKKKEEQDRLDEEGAAIAEAVALHVLLGEDADDLKRNGGNLFVERQSFLPCNNLSRYSLENIGLVYDACKNQTVSNHPNLMAPYSPLVADFYPKWLGEECWGTVGFSVDFLAAQAVSSLKIADDARVDTCVFNKMVRG
ncbi:hypothetical protein F511_10973 [Dorcoceras hygrometricum]|uniref:Uncharacterized protein n=1 Tax=Dorcoceras hygrometricum TaxID=472368 RepID=A0A2Z7AZU0_9LAMI|nr:hypothetical protein F511_10973 [Dorcoceras hygrometricum]